MGFLRAVWILFTTHLSLTVFSRRTLVCALLAAFPVAAACLVLVIARQEEGGAPALEIGWVLQVQIVAPLIALILGSAVIAEEVDNRTISYLFTRPIRRPAILLGRWLAALVVILAVLAASGLATQAMLDRAAGGDPEVAVSAEVAGRLLRTLLLAGAVYSAVFAAAGAVLKHSIIAGLVYAFVCEVFLANLPGKNQVLSLQYYLKSYLVGDDPDLLARLERSLVAFELVPAGEALRTLLAVLLVALGLGSWVIARKQYHVGA